MTTVLLILAGVLLLVALHPFVTYPLSLLVLRSLGVGKVAMASRDEEPLSFAICMCAYNEERVIEQKVRNLLLLREREPGLKILIYVDASTDHTAHILRRYADSIDLYISKERHGKTYGMNLLSAQADADVLVFTDANVMLDLDCL